MIGSITNEHQQDLVVAYMELGEALKLALGFPKDMVIIVSTTGLTSNHDVLLAVSVPNDEETKTDTSRARAHEKLDLVGFGMKLSTIGAEAGDELPLW